MRKEVIVKKVRLIMSRLRFLSTKLRGLDLIPCKSEGSKVFG